MAGLLGNVGSLLGLTTPLPVVGGLLGGSVQAPTILPNEQQPAATSVIVVASTTPVAEATDGAGILTTLTPLVTTPEATPTPTGAPAATVSTPTGLVGVPTSSLVDQEPSIAPLIVPATTGTIPPPSSASDLALPADTAPVPSNTAAPAPAGNPTLVPAISITLGIAAFWLIVGFVLVSRFRKSKWPFRGRKFAQLDDEEKDRMAAAKWDPTRASPSHDRLSRFFAEREREQSKA